MVTLCDDSTDLNNQFGKGHQPNCESNFNETESLHISHMRVLTDKYETAMVYLKERQYAIALDILIDVYEKRCVALGHSHEDTLNTHSVIGLIHSIEGRLDEAISVFNEIYKIKLNKFGVDHKETAATILPLIRLLHKKSKFDEAFQIYLQVENVDLKKAEICFEKERYEVAEKLLRPIYEKRCSSLGNNTEKTQSVLFLLFRALHMQGKFNEAFEFSFKFHPLERSLDIQKEFAKYLHDTRKYDDSLKFFSELYNRMVTIYGQDDLQTLNHKYYIGTVYRKKERYKDALRIFKEIIETGLGSLSTLYDHFSYVIEDFAEVLKEIETFDEGIQFMLKIHQEVSAVIGPEHDHSLCILSHIGITLYGKKRYEDALQCFKTVINARTKSYRLITPLDIKVMDGFRDSLSFIKDINKEFDYLKEITTDLEARPKPLHDMTMYLYYILGFTLAKHKRYNDALEIQQKVCELHNILSNDDLNFHLLNTKYSIGIIYLQMGIYNSSYKQFEEVIEKVTKKLNNNNKEKLDQQKKADEQLDSENTELSDLLSNAKKYKDIAERSINKKEVKTADIYDERIKEFQNSFMDVKSIAPVKIEKITQKRRGLIKSVRPPEKTELSDLIHEDEGNTALHFAARKNALDVVEVLLSSGANPIKANANGYTPLHYAAYNGNVKLAEGILKHVKDTNENELKGYLDHKNTADGKNALHIACHKGFSDLAILLLSYGADVQSKSH